LANLATSVVPYVLLVGAMWFESLVVQIPQSLYTPGGPLSIGSDPGRVHTWYEIQLWSGLGIAAVAAVILVGRIRRTTPRLRLILWPLYIYGLIAIFGITFTYNILGPRLDLSPTNVIGVLFIILALAPVFFAAAALSGAFGRTGRIDELSAWFGTTGGPERDAEPVLARTLGDDSLRLLFWVEEQGGYVDASGTSVALPDNQPGRGLVPIEVAGRRVGAIVYDNVLTADPAPVRAAAQVVAIAVDRERIARDLHDTVIQRLFAIGLSLQGGLTRTDDEATRVRIEGAIDEIDTAIRDLRSAIFSLHTRRAVGTGVRDEVLALTSETARALGFQPSVRFDGLVDAEVTDTVRAELMPSLREALTNIVKHAGAKRASVSVTVTDEIVLSVTDDGIGISDAASGGGRGLANLAERAEALGGSCVIRPGELSRRAYAVPPTFCRSDE
jgi:signal transduction histidine kinase